MLTFADALHQLDTSNRGARTSESLEAEHHRETLLHAPMVLLNHVVAVFR
jgi:hypothetical protein